MKTIRLLLLLAAVTGGTSGCGGPQSALAATGRDAAQIEHLFIVMTVGERCSSGRASCDRRLCDSRSRVHSRRAASVLIIGGGVVLPAVVLGGLIVYGLPLLPDVLAPPTAGGVSIQVTAKQWWWRVEYMTPSGPIETANEVRLPVGQRIEVKLASPDVTHSFWVPSLAGKMDMIPGRSTRLAEALVRWIGDADRIKPGVHMPAFRALAADDLSALAAYLGGLR